MRWTRTDRAGRASTITSPLTVTGWPSCRTPRFPAGGDVAATRQVLDSLDGPAVLVGHSYGGVVITEAGNAEPSPRIWIRMRRPRLPGAGDWRWSSSGQDCSAHSSVKTP